MTNPVNVFQPAIDALEKDYEDLERQANGLLTSINVLRTKAGMPPRPPGQLGGAESGSANTGNGRQIVLHSDTFTGKKLSSAVREYLEMRKSSGGDAPATSREIFDALKQGGFASNAKDDATAIVVLRTLLRKNTVTFAKLRNGKYGLRSWYPNLRTSKEATAAGRSSDVTMVDDETDQTDNDENLPEKETTAA